MVMIPLGGGDNAPHAAAAPPVTDRVDRAMWVLTACEVVTCLLPSPRERRWRRGGGDQQEGPEKTGDLWSFEVVDKLVPPSCATTICPIIHQKNAVE